MTPELIHLLERTPGIIRTRQGIRCGGIEPSDFTRLLTMKKPTTNLKEGEWAQVRRGLYKGDVGLIVAVKHWGVEVLLLPRLNPPAGDFTLKRKRSSIPPITALFDLAEFSRTHEVIPEKQGNDSYIVGGLTFEHGLLRKCYDFHSLSSIVLDMPSEHTFLFDSSKHPALKLTVFPHPREWSFEEGEKVVMLSAGKWRERYVRAEGVVSALRDKYIDVNLGPEQGIQTYTWQHVRKYFNLGDFVTVTAGRLAGRTGWVDRVDYNTDTVHVVEKAAESVVVGSHTSDKIAVRSST